MPANLELAFADRPEVYAAWAELNGAIKAGMDLRRYELATLAAARRLRSSYCCLAHGSVLQERFGEPVAAIARDHRNAGLAEDGIAKEGDLAIGVKNAFEEGGHRRDI